MSRPRLTFGLIVLNGEPFTRYCLRSVYPFAHEIIVVEGASQFARDIATADGHSIDGTLDVLHRFKEEEDPEGKIQIVTRHGFWSEKDEQDHAYVERATGDYIWALSVDEFYHPRDMEYISGMLASDREISAVSFRQIVFWGGFGYVTDGWYLRRGANVCTRVFRWGKGYTHAAHRPLTFVDDMGINVAQKKCVRGRELARRGIFLYHYSQLFPQQVMRKSIYYDACPMIVRKKWREWGKENFLGLKNPYRVHDFYGAPSWLSRFNGEHPPAVRQLIDDLSRGVVNAELRSNSDVEKVLSSWRYRAGSRILKGLSHIVRCFDKSGLGKLRRSLLNLPDKFSHGCKRLLRGFQSPGLF